MSTLYPQHQHLLNDPQDHAAQPALAGALPAHALGRVVAVLVTAVTSALVLLWLGGCAALPAQGQRAPSMALALDGQASTLGRVAAASLPVAMPETGADAAPAPSGLRLLADGDHALEARLALIARAEHTLDLQTYVLANDATGARVLRALADAAARGVRVRLLVDDLYAHGADALYAAMAMLPNLQVRLFNPLPARGAHFATRVLRSLHEVRRINRRMHNKLFIADNALAIAGGRNIADEYFMRAEAANFIDMDVLAAGPVVLALSAEFDTYWNSPQAWPVHTLAPRTSQAATPAEAAMQVQALTAHATTPAVLTSNDRLGHSPVAQQLAAGRLALSLASVRVVADDPAKAAGQADLARSTRAQVSQVMAAAQQDLVIVSPYFVPGDDGMAMLAGVRARTARLMVMTNSLGATDEPLVHTGYARYRTKLLQLGVDLHELGATLSRKSSLFGSLRSSTGRLHAKVAVVDRRHLLIGSMNMDGRSARHNTELALVIDSPELAAEMASLFRADAMASSYRLRLAEPQAGQAPRIEWLSQQAGQEMLHAGEPDAERANSLALALLGAVIDEDML